LVQPFRFYRLALVLVASRKRVQDIGDVRMVRPDLTFEDRQGLTREHDCSSEFPPRPSGDGVVMEPAGVRQRIRSPLKPCSGEASLTVGAIKSFGHEGQWVLARHLQRLSVDNAYRISAVTARVWDRSGHHRTV
jgi:hypothetical protein